MTELEHATQRLRTWLLDYGLNISRPFANHLQLVLDELDRLAPLPDAEDLTWRYRALSAEKKNGLYLSEITALRQQLLEVKA